MWTVYISIGVFVLVLASWLVATECQAEATAWYNATTSLSDQIAFAALKGLPAEKVDTNISTAFAVKGHELNCIQPKLPTG